MDREQRPVREERPEAEPSHGDTTQIDVRELADRVYRLMRDELRLARARGERAERERE